jgi:hypothetical protein
MSEITTIKIYKENLFWWKRCCKIKGFNSMKMFAEIERQCKLHHQRKTYEELPMPSDFKKPLQGIKLSKDKNKSIQKRVAYNQ